MKKRIVIAIATLIIYTTAFWGGLHIYHTQKDNALLKTQTDVFQASVEKVINASKSSYSTDFSLLDMEYVRSEYEENERGQKFYEPTIYYESENFVNLTNEEKIEFFGKVEYYYDDDVGKTFGEDSNQVGHGGLHILSGGHEYAAYEALGKWNTILFEDGERIHGHRPSSNDISYQYGRGEYNALFYLAGFVIIAGIFAYLIKKQATIEKAQREKNAFHNAVNNHTWEFPVKDFHAKCKEQGITDTNTAFSRKKIENIAKSILTEAGVPEEAQGWYLQRAAKYYNDESSRIVNEAAAEEKQWKTTLHTVSPSDWNYHKLEKAEKVKDMYGTQKREYLLQSELESTQGLLGYSKDKHFKPALQKEKDWAVHGGIAQGIAGPAAGAVTAMNVMRENEKIREQNAAMLQVSAILNQQRYADEARYRKEIKELEEELRVLPEKVVFDNISTEEIMSAFQISVKEISRHTERSEGCMNIWLSIRQTRSLHLDIPADAKIVLDGSICGKVFTAKEQPNSECPGGVEVGDFIASIDMYGIPYHNGLRDGITLEAHSVQGYCSRFYGDINTKYVCKLTGKPNFWLMER